MRSSSKKTSVVFGILVMILTSSLFPKYALAGQAEAQAACDKISSQVKGTGIKYFNYLIYSAIPFTGSLSPTVTDKGNGTFECKFDAAGQLIKFDIDDSGKVKAASRTDNGCGLTTDWSFQKCFWEPLMSSLGSWFLTIGGSLLWLSGALFDLLVWHVIIGFGDSISGGMTQAINVGWTLFRDIANIAIIGIFVFIAIGIILGLKTYGNKKLVANVIIVAVLLNFSLLFTKMIIDFSNFTAYQFYAAAAKSNGNDVSNNPKNFDIATAFLKPMGITNLWKTDEITKRVGAQSNSGWAAFFYGLAGGLMLGFVAFVLAYGSYLIALRGILLIIVMITAAIACASYLVPKFAEGAYGFQTWWKALLNASIFAPLLMIFLFISLQLAKAGAQATVQLSNFLTNPNPTATSTQAAEVWGSIFNFIVVTGLLFASFKISSKIASSVPFSDLPLKWGKMAVSAGTSLATGIPGLAGGGIASLYGRYRYGTAESLSQGAKMATARADLHGENLRAALKRGDEKAAAEHRAKMAEQEREATRLSTRAYRIQQRSPVKAISKRIQERAKQAREIAKLATPTPEMIAKIRGQAGAVDPALLRSQADAAKANQLDAEARKAEAESAAAIAQEKMRNEAVEATRGNLTYSAQHRDLDTAKADQQGIETAIRSAFTSAADGLGETLKSKIQSVNVLDPAAMRSLREEIAKEAGPGRADDISKRLTQVEGEHASEMRNIRQRIDNARAAIARGAIADPTLQSPELQNATKNFNQLAGAVQVAEQDAKYYEKQFDSLDKQAKAAADAARESADLTVANVGGRIARRGTDVIPDIIRLDRTASAEAAMKMIREGRTRSRRGRELFRGLMRENRDATDTTST